jgi:uncharacterized membrane protein YfcA
MSGAEAATLLEFAAAIAAVGVIAGVLAGLLGVGGGIVTVPFLLVVLEALGVDRALSTHVAVGTSLAAIVPTSIMSARSHRARGGLDAAVFRLWGPAIFIGAVGGTAVAGQARGTTLNAVFAVGAVVVAVYMIAAREPAGGGGAARAPRPWPQRALAALIGAISTMMGIGGGTFTVPVLTAFGHGVRRAVGTSAALGIVISVPGSLGFVAAGWGEAGLPPWSLGYVNLIGAALLVPTAMVCAPLGARLAHSIPPRALRLAFAAFLLATAASMAAKLV